METPAPSKSDNLRIASRKPEGGYCVVSSHALLNAWMAFRRKNIELLDLRVWFGVLEVLARRCGAAKGVRPRYQPAELLPLTGCTSVQRMRASLRRLEGAGLVRWKEYDVWAATRASDFNGLDDIPIADRPVPVPRRVLRYLAGMARPVLIATTVGHLLRGLYLRNGTCISGGRCKASWVSEMFHVDVRNVKAARRAMAQNGFLLAVSSSQTAMNRWGQAFVINLEWRFESAAPPRSSPPRRAPNALQSPLPGENKNLLIRSGTPKPAWRGGIGAYSKNENTREVCFRKVLFHDLEHPERTAKLFAEAVRAGRVQNTCCDRLRVFAAAEHAKAYGKNPCGLFVWLIRERRWTHINQRDEERARLRIAALLEESSRFVRRRQPALAQNGSASTATRRAAPEAARQVLAGTGVAAYPILPAVSAALAKQGRLAGQP